jgi:hypothetical protein
LDYAKYVKKNGMNTPVEFVKTHNCSCIVYKCIHSRPASKRHGEINTSEGIEEVRNVWKKIGRKSRSRRCKMALQRRKIKEREEGIRWQGGRIEVK